MRYTIRAVYAEYESGIDAIQEMDFPISWENVDTAKSVLRRLRDLYVHERQHEGKRNTSLEEMAEYTRQMIELTQHENWYSIGMQVTADDGSERFVTLPWRDRGASLQTASVVEVEEHDGDMRFSPADLPDSYFEK